MDAHTSMYIEIKRVLESITEPESYIFDQKTYLRLRKISRMLGLKSIEIDQWLAKMAKSCPHARQNTAIENRYKTTRCQDCGDVLDSRPLPGVSYDRD